MGKAEIPGFDPDYEGEWSGNAQIVRSIYGSQVQTETQGRLLVLLINGNAYAFDVDSTAGLLTIIRKADDEGPTGRELTPEEAART